MMNAGNSGIYDIGSAGARHETLNVCLRIGSIGTMIALFIPLPPTL